MLAGQGRQNMVATLDVAMPAPPLTGNEDQHLFLESLYSLTPELKEDMEDLQAVESMTVHGVLHAATLCPLRIPLPFPPILGSRVSQCRLLLDKPISGSQSRTSLDMHSIPMAARLRSSNVVLPCLGNLRKLGIERASPGIGLLRSWGLEKEEVEDMGEVLSKMVQALDPQPEESADLDFNHLVRQSSVSSPFFFFFFF